MKKIPVKCPRCKKEFMYYDSEFRPFCCHKCKLIDLGQWLNESYTIPVATNDLDDDSENDSDFEGREE